MENTEIYGERLDEPLGRAVLEVHRQIDLDRQLGVLLRTAVAWCSAPCGVAFARSEDGRTWVVCGATDAGAIGGMVDAGAWARERLIDSPGFGVRLHDGPGPFADPAAAGLSIPACGEQGEVGGWLVLPLGEPPDGDLRLRLERLFELCRPAIDNGLRVRALRELVIKDDTARCYNRRYFEDFLPEELARAKRFQSPLSLIFLDMDDLKQVNNRYGHAMGSRTLFELSLRVQSKIRKFDKLFRFGGDEFCIVLPETAWHGALEVAERVRDAILRVPFLAKEMRESGGIEMSASLGIAAYPLHARNRAELIERADRAMQRVKKTGKNAIGIAEIEAEHAE